MADLTSITDFINSLDSQAAAWYRGITGTPVVVPASNAQIAAQQAIAIQQQAQANLLNTNPTLAGILANPTLIVVIVGALLILAFLVFKK